MNNNVVKITVDSSGEAKRNAKWCLIDPCNRQGSATLCTNEFFGIGESACIYEVKIGKITCGRCIEIIKEYKKINL